MKIGDEVYIHGFVDEIRKDTVIIRNKGGYFGTDAEEVAPTVEPMRWIPVTERLPETDEMMLVTCMPKNGNANVNRAYYDGQFWHGSGSMSGVIAWMPLPEPYKGEE